MPTNLLQRRQSAFVLWRVSNTSPPPALVLQRVQAGAPLTVTDVREITMKPVAGFTDLWEVPAQECGLVDGQIYHYWFEVTVPSPPGGPVRRVRIADPAATMVDWRVVAPRASSAGFDAYPAAVVRAQAGSLVPSDAGDAIASFDGEPAPETLPTNSQLVLYELPAAWTRQADAGGRDTGVGSFRDVIALLDAGVAGDPFTDSEVTRAGRAYLKELGVNGLELLPPADSFYNRQWGYGTTNFLAPDFELKAPTGETVRLIDLRGQAVLVNLWATWCPPCRAEMTSIEKMYQEYKDRKFVVLAVNMTYQDDSLAILPFVNEQKLTFPILLDETGEMANAYQLRSLPSSYFIRPDGIINEVVIGGPMSEALLRTRIEDILK